MADQPLSQVITRGGVGKHGIKTKVQQKSPPIIQPKIHVKSPVIQRPDLPAKIFNKGMDLCYT